MTPTRFRLTIYSKMMGEDPPDNNRVVSADGTNGGAVRFAAVEVGVRQATRTVFTFTNSRIP